MTTPAMAAPAAPQPAKVVLKQTRHADVDGDGRRDTVRIYDAGKSGENTVWRVKVTTAKGRTSSVTIKLPSYQTTGNLWRGWALLDGSRGAEIILEPHTDDFTTYIVLNWRGGALHRELAPGAEKEWVAATETDRSGFRFFTASGKRYVNAWDATCPDQPSRPGMCTVKTVRHIWRNGAWHKVATLPTTKVSNQAIYARSPLGALKIHA
jgi:hypothetical protein